MRGDRVFGAVMMVVALGYLLGARNIETSFMSDPLGPRVFPYMIGGLMMVCALFMVLRPDPEADWPRGATLVRLGVALVVLVGYALLIDGWGFILPTILASGIISYLIEPRPLWAALSGVGIGFGLYTLFKIVLGLGLVAWPVGWTG